MVRPAQPIPAQFTTLKSGAWATAASTLAMTSSVEVTSVRTNTPPISLARASPASSLRSATTTLAPSRGQEPGRCLPEARGPAGDDC